MSRSALETVQIQREYIRRLEKEIDILQCKVGKLTDALSFYSPGFDWFPYTQDTGKLQSPILEDRGRRAQEVLESLR